MSIKGYLDADVKILADDLNAPYIRDEEGITEIIKTATLQERTIRKYLNNPKLYGYTVLGEPVYTEVKKITLTNTDLVTLDLAPEGKRYYSGSNVFVTKDGHCYTSSIRGENSNKALVVYYIYTNNTVTFQAQEPGWTDFLNGGPVDIYFYYRFTYIN